MDGKKPAKSRWCPYNCLPCNDDHKEKAKNIIPLQLSVLYTGKGWVLGSRLPSAPPIFLRVKALGTRLG